MTVKIVSWNIAGMIAPWHSLITMDADVALLQEAAAPPHQVAKRIGVDPAVWYTAGWPGWQARTAIANLSQRAEVEWITAEASRRKQIRCELGVSRLRNTHGRPRESRWGRAVHCCLHVFLLGKPPLFGARKLDRARRFVPIAVVSDLSVFIGTHGRAPSTGSWRPQSSRYVVMGIMVASTGPVVRYGRMCSREWKALDGQSFVGPASPRRFAGWRNFVAGGTAPSRARMSPRTAQRQTQPGATGQLELCLRLAEYMPTPLSVRAI